MELFLIETNISEDFSCLIWVLTYKGECMSSASNSGKLDIPEYMVRLLNIL